MKLILDVFENKEKIENAYVAIGNFDGVHKGHRALIEKVVQEAKEKNGVSVVFSFMNHTKSVVKEDEVPELINTTEEKLYLLEKLGVDIVVLQPFTQKFCNLTGEEFVEEILIKHLDAKELCVGFNFRFGRGKSHGAEELHKICESHNMSFTKVPAVKVSMEDKDDSNNKKVISSTLIRDLIVKGEIEKVNAYLGEPYIIIGEVIHGRKLGRVLGFPTANLEMKDKAYLPYGIYGGYAEIIEEEKENNKDGNNNGNLYSKRYNVVINIGKNPTLKPGERTIEVHILDFDKDIYGKKLYISVIKYLREEVKFGSMDELKNQIAKDIESWKNQLENNQEIIKK